MATKSRLAEEIKGMTIAGSSTRSKYRGRKRNSITLEIARAEALTCKTRTEFGEKYAGSWRFLQKRGFRVLDDACSHMSGYTQWSTEKVLLLARTCKARNEFKKKHHSAWLHMQQNKLQDICYAHMGPPEKVGRKKGTKNKPKPKPIPAPIEAPAPKTTKDLIVDMIKKRIMN